MKKWNVWFIIQELKVEFLVIIKVGTGLLIIRSDKNMIDRIFIYPGSVILLHVTAWTNVISVNMRFLRINLLCNLGTYCWSPSLVIRQFFHLLWFLFSNTRQLSVTQSAFLWRWVFDCCSCRVCIRLFVLTVT